MDPLEPWPVSLSLILSSGQCREHYCRTQSLASGLPAAVAMLILTLSDSRPRPCPPLLIRPSPCLILSPPMSSEPAAQTNRTLVRPLLTRRRSEWPQGRGCENRRPPSKSYYSRRRLVTLPGKQLATSISSLSLTLTFPLYCLCVGGTQVLPANGQRLARL